MPNVWSYLKINARQKAMVRYFSHTRGEVSWEEMARWLDTRDLVSWGTHAYILFPKLNIEMVRGIIEFIAGHPKDRRTQGTAQGRDAPESQFANSPIRAGFVGYPLPFPGH